MIHFQIIEVCLTYPGLCYMKYSSKSPEKIRETLPTTLLNTCVQSSLSFFALHIKDAFLITKL